MSIGVKATFVQLIPTVASLVPSGSVFLDSANANASSIKNTSGVVVVINNASAATNLVTKIMQAAGIYAVNTPVSKRADGQIEIADSNAPSGQDLIGVMLQASNAPGDLVQVLLVGANMENALSGLGFNVGDEIYVSDEGGYTNDPSTLTNMDSIIKIGIADCGAGGATSVATDLILFPDVVSST
jgi:hypothetical protein